MTLVPPVAVLIRIVPEVAVQEELGIVLVGVVEEVDGMILAGATG